MRVASLPDREDAGSDAADTGADASLDADESDVMDAADVEGPDADAGCEPGARKCEGNTPWKCDDEGAWTELPACGWPTPLCLEGMCVFEPVCTKQGWCWENPRPFARVATAWGASTDDLWLGSGDGLLLHWDGTRFTVTALPFPIQITALWGSAGDDVFAAGVAACMPHLGCSSALAHFDGVAWSTVSTEGDDGYSDLWTAGSTDVWATRPVFNLNTTTPPESFVRRWDGSTWSTLGEDAAAVWGSSSDDVWAVGTNGHALHWDGSSVVAEPTGTDVKLQDVWGVSADDVWIVGKDATILRWNGTQLVSVPAPVSGNLFHVRGSSASDVWVGETASYGSDALWNWDGNSWVLTDFEGVLGELWAFSPTDVWVAGDPMQHFDGASWSGTASTVTQSTLTDVWVNGQDDVWAVGSSGSVLHWDGDSWTQEPSVSGGDWNALGGTTSDDVWGVGADGAVVHWNGVQWSPVSSGTDFSLYDVWVAAPGDVWVVGGDNASGFVLRGGPSGLALQHETSVRLDGIWGTSADDVWAVGQAGTVLHWDGLSWTSVDSPTDNSLLAVFGLSADDVWAVGTVGTLLHWDGSTWFVLDPVTTMPLLSVWGASTDDIWAVGTYVRNPPGMYTFKPSTIHWDGTSWSVVSDLGGLGLRGVAGLASGEAWAVGRGGTILHLAPPADD